MLRLKNELRWAEHWLSTPYVPAESFPGDKMVQPPYADVFNTTPNTRGLNMTRLAFASAHVFGAQYDREGRYTSVERIKRMMLATDILDNHLDKPKLADEQRVGRHRAAVGLVRNVLQVPTESEDILPPAGSAAFPSKLLGALGYWGNSVHAQGDPRQAMSSDFQRMVLDASTDYLDLGLRKFLADDIHDYATLIYDEGERYGHLWAATAWSTQPETEFSQKQFERFYAWMGTFVGKVAQAKAAFELGEACGDRNTSFNPPIVRGGATLLRAAFDDSRGILWPALKVGLRNVRPGWGKVAFTL